ncbi:bifunctional diguanylate cyclase/phosphodiesterase [Legionella sp. PC997]|uniref:sensor domain-containing protein n=1 Tax=Legionella sp. PC997 TaxID=2755562 RepID=UPI0015F96D39|nr:bifunctional diguanylate cyclase/phosphodiesterase [Legionella sp. PC997]QMT59076.1 bifunctional diguanylate cyclase/phosphodiesterase [Legionella sp. PC997]
MKSEELKKDNYWETFVDALSEAILVLDLSGKILYANHASCILFNKGSVDLIGSDFSYPIELEKPTKIEILDVNNQIIYAEVYMKKTIWKHNPAWVATLHDITERENVEKKLHLLANVFHFAKEGIVVTDPDLNIIDVNAEFTNITQYKKEEVLGKKPNILKSNIQGVGFYKKMWAHLKSQGYWYGEIWNKKKNNELYPQLLAISEVKNVDGDLVNYVGVFYDITQQEEQKKQLLHLAYHDSLTNLANRKSLLEQLETAMLKTRRLNNYIALVFFDIDDFKSVNDLYSHKTGDNLLIETAQRVKNLIRETDTLARIGGDEFVLLLEGLSHPYDFKPVMDKIYENLKKPIIIDSHKIFITISAGICFYPQKIAIGPSGLLSQADQAMYKSKMTGKNKYSLYDVALDLEIRKQERLINAIKSSIKNNELKLYYQPKVNMKTGKILGLEGLIRWEHPKKGLLLPNQFLPQITNDAFSFTLLEFTLKEALEQIRLWTHIDDQLTISINISARQLEQENFFEKLMNIVKLYPKNIYSRLELEILESSIINKFELTSGIIKKCNKIGIEFSLDDFGTKYSSLNYLVNLPFRYMKIDTEFIRNTLISERDTKILRAILDIAKAINVMVIAEGVETQEHINHLINLGCHLGQGFAISKAMPAEQFAQWYQSWNSKRRGNHKPGG